jgi:hypothetical protein
MQIDISDGDAHVGVTALAEQRERAGRLDALVEAAMRRFGSATVQRAEVEGLHLDFRPLTAHAPARLEAIARTPEEASQLRRRPAPTQFALVQTAECRDRALAPGAGSPDTRNRILAMLPRLLENRPPTVVDAHGITCAPAGVRTAVAGWPASQFQFADRSGTQWAARVIPLERPRVWLVVDIGPGAATDRSECELRWLSDFDALCTERLVPERAASPVSDELIARFLASAVAAVERVSRDDILARYSNVAAAAARRPVYGLAAWWLGWKGPRTAHALGHGVKNAFDRVKQGLELMQDPARVDAYREWGVPIPGHPYRE